jgi:hypothetical protein
MRFIFSYSDYIDLKRFAFAQHLFCFMSAKLMGERSKSVTVRPPI